MTRSLLLVLGLVLFLFPAAAQLKKSYYGTYQGNIPGYEINTGVEKFKVAAAPIEIQVSATGLQVKIGNQEMKGTWSLLLEAKPYFVLVGKMENQVAQERIIVYKKGRKISREGIRPQPDAMLEKVKR